MDNYWMRRSMRYIVPLWIAIFLISYAGVVSPAAFSQTANWSGYDLSSWMGNAAVVKAEVIRENNQTKISENVWGLSQQHDNNIVAHRVSRSRHFLYLCCPTSPLLDDYTDSSYNAVIHKDGMSFFLLIENNANAPPLCSYEIV